MTSMTPKRPPGGGGTPRGPKDGPIRVRPGGIKGGPRPIKTATPSVPPPSSVGNPRGPRPIRVIPETNPYGGGGGKPRPPGLGGPIKTSTPPAPPPGGGGKPRGPRGFGPTDGPIRPKGGPMPPKTGMKTGGSVKGKKGC